DQGPQGQGYGQGYGQGPYGAPSSPFGGGSFLGTAAATAAGVVGGSLLLNSIRGMMGGHHQAFGDTTVASDRASSPWSDQSDSSMARDLGVNDISRTADRGDDNSRTGLFDQASNDGDNDQDETDFDSDDFGNDDSDYA